MFILIGKPQSSNEPNNDVNKPKIWKIWTLEFEAQMRMLDNAGFRTGYIYRQPLLRASNRANVNLENIEIPPAAQNHLSNDNDFLLDNWLAPLKNLINSSVQQKKEKMNWINTPNSYQRVELSETGTEDPKKITKWINGDNAVNGSQQNMKIDSSHQFVPLNENNKREFHMKQQKMKEYRRQNQISEGNFFFIS